MLVRVGNCTQCGACCDNFRAMTIINKWKSKGLVEGVDFFVPLHFPCFKYHFENGKCICDNYKNRPRYCKDFPICAEDIAEYPECTYRFVEVADAKNGISVL